MPTDRVVFGSKVRVLDLDLNEEEDFILVGPGEEDYDQNKILLTSPIGQGLVGKKVGDEVEVPIPEGTLKLKIVEIGIELNLGPGSGIRRSSIQHDPRFARSVRAGRSPLRSRLAVEAQPVPGASEGSGAAP